MGKMMHVLETPEELKTYDSWVRSHPQGSLWQSLAWKRYQEALGRETRIYALMEEEQMLASALVIIDRTTFGFSTWDIPRGPLFERLANSDQRLANALVEDIVHDAKTERCLSLALSPPSPLPPRTNVPVRYGRATPYPLHNSPRHEQPEATRMIDLTQSEEEILGQMKPKGRYNISVAAKHGVHVALATDIEAFFALLKKTGQRDNFTIHSEHHYQAFLKDLAGSFLLLASLPPNPEPIAGLLGVAWGKTGYYYYGASAYAFRALMAPYALQWAAMRHCKAQGCTSYDLLGIAPPDAAANHPWQGVGAFKEKFGGTVVTSPPEQQIVLRPIANAFLQMKRRLVD